MRAQANALTITGLMTITGCATINDAGSRPEYTPPTVYPVLQTLALPESREGVWTRFTSNLKATDYSIEQLDQQAGIARLRFRSDRPDEWVDCGVTRRKDVVYETAASSKYRVDRLTELGLDQFEVERSTHLQGLANVLIQETTVESSQVLINVLYKIDVELFAQQQSDKTGITKDTLTSTLPSWITFSSQSTPSSNQNAEGVRCVSKGLIEGELLRLSQ